MYRKRAIKLLFVAGMLLPFLFVTNVPGVLAADVSGDSPVVISQEPDEASAEAVLCVLNEAVGLLTEITICNEDPVCITKSVLYTALDMLACLNPEDQATTEFVCVSKGILNMVEDLDFCGDDAGCIIMTVITDSLDILACYGG